MRAVILAKLRCPASGEPLVERAGELVSASGKHRYPLHAGRIPLFAERPQARDAAAQQAHYDAIAGAYLAHLGYPHTQAYQQEIDRRFLELLGPGPLGHVAELCCGWGEALGLLAERVDEGLGIDISVCMLEAAAARLPTRLELLQADATQLPLADAQLDQVVMFGGIHHVGDRRGLFREVARVLKPGGRFLWREPASDFWPWRALRAVIYRLSPALDHQTERPLRFCETAPLLAAAGLRLRAWHTCGFAGFAALMNSDVLIVNRWLRFVPGIRRLARAAARFDAWCLRLPGLDRAGLQVVGCAEKPGAPPAGSGLD